MGVFYEVLKEVFGGDDECRYLVIIFLCKLIFSVLDH